MGLTYLLFGMAERSDVEDGSAFPLAGRTQWTLQLDVARFLAAGTLDVVVEVSPTGDDGTWAQLYAFPQQNAAGSVTKKVVSNDFAKPGAGEVYLRGRISGVTGTVLARLTAVAPFVDPDDPADQALFSQQFREWEDGFARTIVAAEAEVLDLLSRRQAPGLDVVLRAGGTYYWPPSAWASPVERDPLLVQQAVDLPLGVVMDANMALPGFGEAMRHEVIRQAEWMFRRELLARSGEASDQVTLRGLGMRAPDLGAALRHYRQAGATYYRGRG